jgi:hypothetical protein
MYAEAEAEASGDARPESPASRVKRNITAGSTWMRLLFMALFGGIFWLLHCVLAVVVVVQFLIVLATGSPNQRLLTFGHELGIYYHDIVVFLTLKTEAKPYPFADWRREPSG